MQNSKELISNPNKQPYFEATGEPFEREANVASLSDLMVGPCPTRKG